MTAKRFPKCDCLIDGNKMCEKHNNIDNTYYSYCIYCIMEGHMWEEEWDSWHEISGRITDLIKMGYTDYKNGRTQTYSDKLPKYSDISSARDRGHLSEIHSFVYCYELGQQMAMGLNLLNSTPERHFYNIYSEI